MRWWRQWMSTHQDDPPASRSWPGVAPHPESSYPPYSFVLDAAKVHVQIERSGCGWMHRVFHDGKLLGEHWARQRNPVDAVARVCGTNIANNGSWGIHTIVEKGLP